MLKIVFIQADTKEELDAVRQALPNLFTSDLSEEDVKKQRRSEINRQNYQKRKESQSENSLNQSELSLKKSENSLNQSEFLEKEEKERTKEKEEKDINNIYLKTTSLSADSKNSTSENLKISEKPKLKPEQAEFWLFAKENAVMGMQFYVKTGLFPVKKEFGRWVNDLKDLAEAEITVSEMENAVDYMRSQNIPIGAPGSILKIARWLKVSPQSAPSPKSNQPRWDEAAKNVEERLTQISALTGLFDSGYSGEVVDI